MVVHDGDIVYNTLNTNMKDKKMASTEVAVKTQIQLKEPPMFRLIYVNDNKTSCEFVIDSLNDHFGYTVETAQKIADDVHTLGSAVVAVLPFEVAEQKGIEITAEARRENYPLQIKIEKEEA